MEIRLGRGLKALYVALLQADGRLIKESTSRQRQKALETSGNGVCSTACGDTLPSGRREAPAAAVLPKGVTESGLLQTHQQRCG